MSQKVQTVLGPINADDLGATLTHEHLSMDFSSIRILPPEDSKEMAECPFTLENIHWIQRHPFNHRNNLKLNDNAAHEAVLEEMHFFKKWGGQTIVENTTTGLQRNVKFLKEVALKTGVNIVAGAGYYVGNFQTESVKNYSVEKLAETMRQEMTVGCDGTDIKCGVLGELASIYPMQTFEKHVLQAAAIVQEELDCPVIAHPHRLEESPYEIVRVFQEAGGNSNRLVMSHLDRTFTSVPQLCEFGKLGTFLEFDMFGIECSDYQLNPEIDMPSDAQRIQLLKGMVQDGLEDKIVISHDIYAKHRLMKFGGHGYSHILRYIVPKMLKRGITQNIIDKFLKENPRNWLSN